MPAAFAPSTDYREAESVYSFRGTELKRVLKRCISHYLPLSPTISHYLPGTELKRVFKRWQAHRSPSELYNHGFENMESLGAVSGAIERSRWLGTKEVDLLRLLGTA